MVQFNRFLALMSIGSSLVAATSPVASVSAIRHTGRSVGKEVDYKDLTLYVTGKKSDTAVLYLTDVFGIQLSENRLLADSFGRAGYLTVAPDLFNGTPAPGDINGTPGFNVTEFLNNHRPEITDPKIATTIEYIRTKLRIKKIAVTGYCFGGRYAFRFLAEGKGADAGFAAHPSLLQDAEVLAIKGPASVAAAEVDDLLPAAARHNLEELLATTDQPYSLALYSGTNHGFGVRANVSDPQQKFGKEEAFFQAVRWFDSWAKTAK
ncbi:Hydrolase tropI [Paramyrothecium foliicola]|nr:Hydrolase tropI [Paramyrothecium foliicola]